MDLRSVRFAYHPKIRGLSFLHTSAGGAQNCSAISGTFTAHFDSTGEITAHFLGRDQIRSGVQKGIDHGQSLRLIGAIKVTSAIANSNYLILQVVTSSLIAPYY